MRRVGGQRDTERLRSLHPALLCAVLNTPEDQKWRILGQISKLCADGESLAREIYPYKDGLALPDLYYHSIYKNFRV